MRKFTNEFNPGIFNKNINLFLDYIVYLIPLFAKVSHNAQIQLFCNFEMKLHIK